MLQASSSRLAAAAAPPSIPQKRFVTDKNGKMAVLYYRPSGDDVRGLVVLVPGSRGGMGPGQTPSSIGTFDPKIRSIYQLLARQLAERHQLAVVHLHWRLCPTRKGAPPGTLKSPEQLFMGCNDVMLAARFLRSQHHDVSLPLVMVGFSFGGPAVLAAAARACSRDACDGQDREAIDTDASSSGGGGGGAGSGGGGGGGGEVVETTPHSVPEAAEDTEKIAAALDSRSKRSRSSRWRTAEVGPLAGVISLAGGLRVGLDNSAATTEIGDKLVGGMSRSRPHDYRGLDSESCVSALACRDVPLLLVHGLADDDVDPRASQAIYDVASGPKGLVWLEGCGHQFRHRFDELLQRLLDWIPALVCGERLAEIVAKRAPAPHGGCAADERDHAAQRQRGVAQEATTARAQLPLDLDMMSLGPAPRLPLPP
jgi:pimeloyl-ACP methyl ester carboxylesterase